MAKARWVEKQNSELVPVSYFHRVALSNDRILSVHNAEVTFTYCDRLLPSKLPVGEIICRCLLHVLPSGFKRIRHVSFLGNRSALRFSPSGLI